MVKGKKKLNVIAIVEKEPLELEEYLGPGEIKVVACTKLMLNGGRLKVKPGDVIILGPVDTEQGVHIDKLLNNTAVVPYESMEQAAAIKAEWETRPKVRR